MLETLFILVYISISAVVVWKLIGVGIQDFKDLDSDSE